MKNIVISAVNLFEGGPLTILNDCLDYTYSFSKKYPKYNFTFFVHKKNLLNFKKCARIKFIELPKSRNSYFFRFYYEYYFFYKFSKRNKIDFWLSLHDISPILFKTRQAVYCHNPSMFYKPSFSDIFYQKKLLLFRYFYDLVYRINIHSNQYVIVQQNWLKDKFIEHFNISSEKIIISNPFSSKENFNKPRNKVHYNSEESISFFYPSFPRKFKNFEIICEAVKILRLKTNKNFSVYLTIDGSENNYSKSLINKFQHLENIKFIGIISIEDVYKYYESVDCLIFPSKLETWGLPISEFKHFDKPIFAANLPYTKETVGNYKKVNFFHPNDPNELCDLMLNIIEGNYIFKGNEFKSNDKLSISGWENLFSKIILES